MNKNHRGGNWHFEIVCIIINITILISEELKERGTKMAKIVCTKTILGGKERISGTRISVDLIYNYVKDDNITQIYKDYPHLNKNQVKTALDYLDQKLHCAKERVDLVPA